MNETIPTAGVPVFTGQRLLYVVTGSVSAMWAPMWANWLRTAYPEVELKIVLTQSAQNFTGVSALSLMAKTDIVEDAWPESPLSALHVELSHWADSVIVYPATFSFIGRLAQGMADTPAMLALQCTRAPIAVAPALPPGAAEGHSYARHMKELAQWPNLTVVPGVRGISATTGERDTHTPAQLPAVMAMLEKLRYGMKAQADA
ncbi:flavoprotein [Streptomyces sp. NPDC001401]|uniref:flavoprotein n=1 Tax=Streptomyces sp. NPDC001401 TaxID=3364570 RepID=UPI0036C8C6C5